MNSQPFNIYKVEVGDQLFYFLERHSALEFSRLTAEAIGTREKYEYKDNFADGVLVLETPDKFPGVEILKGVTDVLDKDEVRDVDDPNASESEKVIQLRKELDKAKSEAQSAKWKADSAKKEAEKQELNACRLAGILEANGLTADGGQKADSDND